ncbi:phenylalanine--tRNA ligase subunit beta [Kosmotoga olearia]|uniref:Phenylalanine--tRNA ligase beta subunit n=1 Tax=Kosmotoga olearia (strain ATCC BAA-1733 / DSM 21960 / TBF 19.5.1) TaxID=521045 RepID=C5CIN9_KOSOT|nr:phenylalanine--tRNA ligase subunit beta [Kosmotoga olearia]ACR80822.1 phenylalanyl-tRNA synthetase, beta subunit [Kosmotoga olearia TBF 19.5.1]
MRIPVEWLNEIIDLSDKDVQELTSALSLSGTAVEGVEYPWDYLEGAVTGKIEKVIPHPNADKLVVTEVNIGDKLLTVVTADLSVKPEEYVAVLPEGGRLWDLEIRKRNFRGVMSEGMFLSFEELRLEEKSTHILRFSEAVPLGKDVKDILKLNYPVIEVELTPNRGDCLSMIGIARELRAIYKRPLKIPEINEVKGTDKPVEIRIEDEGCQRYTALVMKNVRVKESPLWLKRRLIAAGLRPLNNVVDITNYVLLETGHPVHAFDLAKIPNKKIVVRNASQGEKMTLLDGKVIELLDTDLLITDGETPLALAGIMGGANSGISEETTDVLLEVAVFDPVRIRKTARRLGISTDSSYRFERGIDAKDSLYVIKRLATLLQQLASAEIASGIIDVGQSSEPGTIHLRKWFVDKVLGTVVPIKDVEEILLSLGFSLKESGDGWNVTPPSHRHDIDQEIDLVEEIGRIYGYDKIESELPRITPGGCSQSSEVKTIKRVKNIMTSLGYDEVITYSFINPDSITSLDKNLKYTLLKNPLSIEMSALRPSLLFGLLEVASYNYRRQNRDLKIFEVGKIFSVDPKKPESLSLGFLAMGKENKEDYTDKRMVSFYTFKGVVEDVLESYGVSVTFKEPEESWLEKRASADIYIGEKKIGFFGVFDSSLADRLYEIKNAEVFIAELDLESLLEKETKRCINVNMSPFPRVFRDLSILISPEITYEKIKETIQKAGSKYLTDIRVTDIYRGKGIPKGFRSITISLTFESFTETLKEDEINSAINNIISSLEEIGVKLRG